MRTLSEIAFRLKQEAANLQLWLHPPRMPGTAREGPAPAGLPDLAPVIAKLTDGRFAGEIAILADQIMEHRFPRSDGGLETGPFVDWRRDYRAGISSGPSYFRLIPYLNPSKVGDHKVVWDLNRHQHLIVLAQAHLFSGRDEFLREIEAEIDGWLAANPFMRGINWTSALEVGFRALSWTWVNHLVGGRMESGLRQRLIEGIFRHGCYLERNLSIYFSPNTHLLGEAVALHAIGVMFPQFNAAARWKLTGAELVSEQMRRQVHPDGGHFEQSTYYHVYALDLFLFHHVLARNGDADYRSSLRRMAEYLSALMGPARVLPLMGDDDGGRLFHPYGACDRFGRATLATAAAVLNENAWRYDEGDLHEQAAWWLGASVLHREASAGNTPVSRLFRDSGVAVMTSGPCHVVADVGPFGRGSAGHSHSDTLNVVVSDGPEEILVDAGTYTYVGDVALRDWFRGSRAHNTVMLDGVSQAVPAGAFRWLQPPGVEILRWIGHADHDLIDAVCHYRNLPSGALLHRRQTLFLKPSADTLNAGVLLVSDRLIGLSGEHLVEQYWHPGERLMPTARDRLRIGTRCTLCVANGSFELVDSWRSRAFGDRTAQKAAVVRHRCALPMTMWAALVISDGGDGNGLEIEFKTAPGVPDVAILQLSSGWRLVIKLDERGELDFDVRR